jgi:D-glycero-D-manno-heptose 1,7-bisphosphate phosphatase
VGVNEIITMVKAIFWDRDGVLNDVIDRGENFFVCGKKIRFTAPYNYDEFRLRSGAVEVLETVGKLGYLRILVTNQPDIAYGKMPQKEHERIMLEVKKLPFDDIFICFHRRDDGCLCKKPLPGMLHDATKKWDIDLSLSYMVGDTNDDLEAAKAAGVKFIVVSDGRNHELSSDLRIENLFSILDIIQ